MEVAKLRKPNGCGSCVLLLVMMVTAAPAQTFSTLSDFNGPDGAFPYFVALAQGADGAFYGTTGSGGKRSPTCGQDGCGTVFKVTPDGILTTLDLTSAEGFAPAAGVILATDGNLYGTTQSGGAYGRGTVLSLSTMGTLTALYSFCAQEGYPCPDGSQPTSGLVQGIDNRFYGTTLVGGKSSACAANEGCGTVFRITSDGELTTIYSFCMQSNCADGNSPQGALVQGIDGSFYGTTYFGGTSQCADGCGTVFKVTPTGKLTILHSFNYYDDGAGPEGLAEASDGSFYGTTHSGGAHGEGTAFGITPGGALTTLYSFCSGGSPCVDGAGPIGTLIQATDGKLYGLTEFGGAANRGTIFQITGEGAITTLHSFDNTDGAFPEGSLLQATSGLFYGTADQGGNLACDPADGCGTVFSLSMGLGPFVAFVRSSGKVGQTGPILGQGFTGTTSVSLNGIPASFTVKSDTLLIAKVPSGATTGYVTVTTPSGTLTSNVPFHVIK
jgi:uncharacterized repeat protein (TIGR03803 family)